MPLIDTSPRKASKLASAVSTIIILRFDQWCWVRMNEGHISRIVQVEGVAPKQEETTYVGSEKEETIKPFLVE